MRGFSRGRDAVPTAEPPVSVGGKQLHRLSADRLAAPPGSCSR
ncbi:hypothetical protein PV779_22185 [Streptomyces sp. ID01-9D]|nr:hypothetical protein [Streptomyces sp. ID01-9D]